MTMTWIDDEARRKSNAFPGGGKPRNHHRRKSTGGRRKSVDGRKADGSSSSSSGSSLDSANEADTTGKKVLKGRSTHHRLFGQDEKANKGKNGELEKLRQEMARKQKEENERQKLMSTTEEVETLVEYTIIRNPDKKKKGSKLGLSDEEALAAAAAAGGAKKTISKKMSITHTKTDAKTGKVLSKETKET